MPTGRKGAYAAEILDGFNGTIQVESYGCYTHLAHRNALAAPRLAICWAHDRRKMIKAKPKKGSPIVDEALLHIAGLYKPKDAIRRSEPDHRRAIRQKLSLPLVDEFFASLKAQVARISRKSERALVFRNWRFNRPRMRRPRGRFGGLLPDIT